MDSLIGHRVRHSSYGLGMIVSVDDKGEHIGVRFGCGLKLVSSALLRSQLSQIMGECGPDAVVHKGYRLTAEIRESQGVWYGRVIIENLPDQRPVPGGVLRDNPSECHARAGYSGVL